MIRRLTVLMVLGFWYPTYGQDNILVSPNQYQKYDGGEFWVYLKKGETSLSSSYFQAIFSSDSTYLIKMVRIPIEEYSSVLKDTIFKGKYIIGKGGHLTLLGAHPFTSDTFKVEEIKRKKKDGYGILRGVKFKLNDKFSYLTNERLLYAGCDGNCDYKL